MFDDRMEITNPETLLPVVAKNCGRKQENSYKLSENYKSQIVMRI